MKLSERIQNAVQGGIVDLPVLVEWQRDSAHLEEEKDEYRILYLMAEAKVLSRDALLEQLSEEQHSLSQLGDQPTSRLGQTDQQITQDLTQAEEENEALRYICYHKQGQREAICWLTDLYHYGRINPQSKGE